MQIYAFKLMAAFMMATSTLVLCTKTAARSIAALGYAAAVFIIVGSNFFGRTLFVFPGWILLLSMFILAGNLPTPPAQTIDADWTSTRK